MLYFSKTARNLFIILFRATKTIFPFTWIYSANWPRWFVNLVFIETSIENKSGDVAKSWQKLPRHDYLRWYISPKLFIIIYLCQVDNIHLHMNLFSQLAALVFQPGVHRNTDTTTTTTTTTTTYTDTNVDADADTDNDNDNDAYTNTNVNTYTKLILITILILIYLLLLLLMLLLLLLILILLYLLLMMMIMMMIMIW